MKDIQRDAVRKAMAYLSASGVPYAVILDGEVYATEGLEVNQRVKASPGYDHVAKYNYIERLDAAGHGDIVTCIAPTREEAVSLRSAMGSRIQRTHGKGKCITAIDHKDDGYHVSVMLVLDQPLAA